MFGNPWSESASEMHHLALVPDEQAESLAGFWGQLDTWQAWLKASSCTSETRDNYDRAVVAFYRKSRLTPGTVTEDQIVTYMNGLKDRDSYANMTRKGLRSFHRFAMKRGWRDDDPTLDVPRRRETERDVDFYTPAECRAIVEAAHNHQPTKRPWAIILLFETGGRIGSTASLRPQDVGREAGDRVRFPVAKNDRLYATRLTPMGAEAVNALIALMEPGEETLIGRDKVTLWKWFHTACVEAGLPEGRRHPHLARHTYGTVTYRRTKDLLLTAKALGHKNTQHTAKYAAVVDDDLAAALEESIIS